MLRTPYGMPDGAGAVEVLVGDAVRAPQGFRSHTANVGIKDGTTDFSVLASDRPCVADAVFTQSRFAGPSVTLSRRHLAEGSPRAVVTVSKNANVATGATGQRNAEELAARVGQLLGVPARDVLVASTGVIGRQYPMPRLIAHLDSAPVLGPADLPALARAIMTTDTVPKIAAARCGQAVITGVAKGVGMIEPDLATLLVYLVTDAELPADELRTEFRQVMELTFNSLSIDTDTSTSDTAVLLANGAAGPVPIDEFRRALYAVARSLVLQIARDGEGATKLIQVTVAAARDTRQAKRVAKAIVNSPLVKTAVHGADPNWGRVVMAIGKCSEETDIAPEKVRVWFSDIEVYPRETGTAELVALTEHLRGTEVDIAVELGTGPAGATVWGCDLSDRYIRINADYTT
jgi:glutamate N-acetyltransferase/amino-acid N-acetyltransferase